MSPKSKEIKEKICKDFYPNCVHCTCFRTCFPKNELDDISSKALLEQENMIIRKPYFSSKALLVQN